MLCEIFIFYILPFVFRTKTLTNNLIYSIIFTFISHHNIFLKQKIKKHSQNTLIRGSSQNLSNNKLLQRR